MQRYDFTAMPVLDNEGMFVGIITIDDAIAVSYTHLMLCVQPIARF